MVFWIGYAKWIFCRLHTVHGLADLRFKIEHFSHTDTLFPEKLYNYKTDTKIIYVMRSSNPFSVESSEYDKHVLN